MSLIITPTSLDQFFFLVLILVLLLFYTKKIAYSFIFDPIIFLTFVFVFIAFHLHVQ